MAKKDINATEYMYCSSRLRSLESRMCGKMGISALLECGSYEDAVLKLADLGVELQYDESGEVMLEDSLCRVLDKAFLEVTENCPAPDSFDFLRYAYDCNNIKAVLKCNAKGISPDGMLYRCGCIGVDEVKRAHVDVPMGCPKNMAAAIGEAIEAYAKTKNPQSIDMILDRACFSDMLECARGSGCELAVSLVSARIDLVNLLMCIRILRMKMGELGEKMLMGSLLCGGSLSFEFISEMYEAGYDKLCEKLEFTQYSKLVSNGGKSLSHTELERRADEIYLDVAQQAKFVPFGPEVVIGYLVGCEYEVKNLRIVMSGKRSGTNNETLRERLRGSYV